MVIRPKKDAEGIVVCFFQNSIPSLAYFAIVAASCTTVFADNKIIVHSCPPPASNSIEKVANWVADFDYLGQKLLRRADSTKGEVPSAFGPVVDKSCPHDTILIENGESATRLEIALSYTLKQIAKCYQKFGFRELLDLVSVLRRTKLVCSSPELGKSFSAESVIEGKKKWLPTHKLFGSTTLSTSYDHSYEVHLNPSLLASMSNQNLVTALFHESLHSVGVNNRGWHNEAANRSATACQSSLLEDRIYFLEAVCFPTSRYGREFYFGSSQPLSEPSFGEGPVSKCSKLCKAALTEVDKEARTVLGKLAGPPMVAVPYKPQEVELVCERVRNYGKRLYYFKSRHDDLIRRHELLEMFVVGNYRKAELPRDLASIVALLDSARYETEDAYGYINRSGHLRRLNGLKSKLVAILKEKCGGFIRSSAAPMHICSSDGRSILSQIEQDIEFVKSISPDEVDLILDPWDLESR